MSRSNLFLIAVVLLTGLAVWAHQSKDYMLGLDIKGGTRLTFQLDPQELAQLGRDEASRTQIQRDTVRIMNNRATASLGVQEGTAVAKGDDQIIVELPGFTDVNKARETLGRTAKVQAYHANTVDIGAYTPLDTETLEDGTPYVPFQTRSGQIIKPGDPEYDRMISRWKLILEGKDVADARVLVQGSGVVPEFIFSPDGAAKMQRWSRQYLNKRPNLAFVLDGRVLSISYVRDGVVLSDNAYIDGRFERDYVVNLTETIKSGALPVTLNLIREETVDPTIGNYALDQIIRAGVISFIIICVFLIVYYSFPGVIAAIAMALYALFTLTALKMIDATFSLAAIAGFILSAGMAIDANILVFERIKEELKNGRPLDRAVRLGFKNALSAIVDSNACTIITSMVLASLGEGAVRGFAITLIVGVAISFFTAFIITRALLMGAMGLGIGNSPKAFALDRSWFGEKLEETADARRLPIIGKMRTWFLISVILIIPGLIAIYPLKGIKPNVEFLGGYQGQFKVPEGGEFTAETVRQKLDAAGMTGANIKFATYRGEKYVDVTIPPNDLLRQSEGNAKEVIAKTLGVSTEDSSFSAVGPTIQEETWRNAINMLIFSSALIVLYLTVRFGIGVGGLKNGIKFGGAAILALIHDVIFVVGLSAIVGLAFGWEISALFITAMLTVNGFSVHDTIVIFDRIRENLSRAKPGETLANIIDKSVTQSIARSINTSLMAIITLAILIAIGTPTPEIKFMCVTMMAGIIIGTYSSIFNAAPILYLFDQFTMKRKGEQAGLVAEAMREAKQRAAHAMAAGNQVDGSATATIMNARPTTQQTAPKSKGNAGQSYATIKRRRGVVEVPVDQDEEEDK